jgi:hypothetical protein
MKAQSVIFALICCMLLAFSAGCTVRLKQEEGVHFLCSSNQGKVDNMEFEYSQGRLRSVEHGTQVSAK